MKSSDTFLNRQEEKILMEHIRNTLQAQEVLRAQVHSQVQIVNMNTMIQEE
jgi:hypothetical protein